MATTVTHYGAMRFDKGGLVSFAATIPVTPGTTPAQAFRQMMLERVEGARDDSVYYMQPICQERGFNVLLNPNDGRHSKPHVFRWVDEAADDPLLDPRIQIIELGGAA